MITMKRKKFKPLAARLRNNNAPAENLLINNSKAPNRSAAAAADAATSGTSTFRTRKRRFTRRKH